jgi:GTPase
MNRLSQAGVLAENMLFATLDPTTRKIKLPAKASTKKLSSSFAGEPVSERSRSQEIFLTDTVGFISKLPTNLIAAFR